MDPLADDEMALPTQLLTQACQLRQAVALGQLTDLEALAQLAERVAASGAPARPVGRWRFIMRLLRLVTEFDLTGWPPRRQSHYIVLGESGFATSYQSVDPGSRNQVRHLVAYLPVGLLIGRWLGWPVPWLLEGSTALLRGRPLDQPDIALGRQGVILGDLIGRGHLPPTAVGDWLRQRLGPAGHSAK